MITSEIYSADHDFGKPGTDKVSDLTQDVRFIKRAAGSSCTVNDAKRAGLITPLLHLDEGP